MVGVAWSAPATEALISEAQAALDKGDAQQAAKLTGAALTEDGLSKAQRSRLLLYRGLSEELLGSHDPAMRDFTAALDSHALSDAEQEQALLQRGFLRDGLGRFEGALQDYTAVIALKGENLATALNNRANIYRREHRFTDAQRDYLAALTAGSHRPQYSWYGLGQIAEAQGDTIKAREFYAKAQAADPSYVLASQRLEALGGPPENSIADPPNPVVLHPASQSPAVNPTPSVSADTNGPIVLRDPQRVGAGDVSPIVLHPPKPARDHINRQAPLSTSNRRTSGHLTLRPALDQAEDAASLGSHGQSSREVQLGAWRSEGEASAGWSSARSRAGGALNGFSPHIVTVDLPGRGRYYRLRIRVAAGHSPAALCADLDSKGVDCLPVRN